MLDRSLSARLCVWLMTGTAVLHLLVGLVSGWRLWGGIVHDGVVAPDVLFDPSRNSWFWFTVAALPLLAFARLVRWTHLRTGDLPRSLPWWLLGLSLFVVLMPTSGFWLFWPQTVLAFHATRRSRQRAPSG